MWCKWKLIILSLWFAFMGFSLYAQNGKQKQLETRRQELQQEIQKINALRAENKSKERSELSAIEDFNYKISVLQNLIKVTNQQANLLTREINDNQKEIGNLRTELKLLKDDYAAMIVKSYKSRNQQSRIMFLLSANTFKQAYKRLKYLKQYTDHQEEQGELIKDKTQKLQDINKNLLVQQQEKQALITENKTTKQTLENERKQHEQIMVSIRNSLSKYTAQIQAKQREAARIDREIERIIKAAIVKSNKSSGKTASASSFALTPEEKVLANNFSANKGKLPWPVEKGYVKVGYGTQRSPIDPALTIQSNGVRIATEKGAKAKAVFEGTVTRVVYLKNANPVVMIRHGNFITAYKNLSKVYVKEGETVKTKQNIGEIFTNPTTGETVLNFIVFKDLHTQDPAAWIYQM